MEQATQNESKPHCLRRISSAITEGLEAAFFVVGHFVGDYPVLTIILSLVICGLCGIGLKTFRETTGQEELWVPQTSRLINEKAWVDRVFPTKTRYVSVIMESESDVLTPDFLQAMMDYYSRSVGLTVLGLKFSDFCVKVGSRCRVSSLLELWDYSTTVRRLNHSEIIRTINIVPVSPNFGYEMSTLLGGTVLMANGSIVSASATQMTWLTTGHENIGVIVITLALFAVNVWSFTLLKEEFQLSSYIPSDSYAYQFAMAKERLFDAQGVDAAVYCGSFSYVSYQTQLEAMYHSMSTSQYVQNGTVHAWFINYHTWLNQTGANITSEQQYVSSLQAFFTGAGYSLAHFVSFDDEQKPSAIIGSFITLHHTRQPTSAREIEAMDGLRAIVDGAGLPLYEDRDGLPTHQCFAFSTQYGIYDSNKVLGKELYRNLALAGASVLVVTCVLIADLWTSILVFLCVIFTVVDVAGTLQFSGTTIDTASSILLTLTVGLAVDYSAHIGHTFMTISGPRMDPDRTHLHDHLWA
ncbi:hypothetical protein ACOMHN_057979 [Nucella lapillus]